MSEKEAVCVTVTADTVGQEAVPLFLVRNPLFVLVISLKPNCLLVTREVSTEAHRLLRNRYHVL